MRVGRQQRRHGRRGFVFSVRLTDDQRMELEALKLESDGPRSFGAWILWAARGTQRVHVECPPLAAACKVCGNLVTLARPVRAVLPARAGAQPKTASGSTASSTRPCASCLLRGRCDLESHMLAGQVCSMFVGRRVILDLCAGSGAWSAPYRAAGYHVIPVTLPEHDVRTFAPPEERVHGILAAPPCTEFSLAKNGQSRDYLRALETVSACLRLVAICRPKWWALENPVGMLSQFLGTPRDMWEPCDFGDPWTKRTAIWGEFRLPERGPFVTPLGGGPFCRTCDPEGKRTAWCRNPAHRAITPPGFARAFFEANP